MRLETRRDKHESLDLCDRIDQCERQDLRGVTLGLRETRRLPETTTKQVKPSTRNQIRASARLVRESRGRCERWHYHKMTLS
jgi:hypothetical protein